MYSRILLLTGLLALAAPEAFAQVPATHAQPSSDDDTLVLTLPNEGRPAWARIARLLAARGYVLREANADLLTLRTEFVDMEKVGFVSIFLLVEGHQALLRAYTTPDEQGRGLLLRVVQQGGFLSNTSREWPELETIARILGTSIGYYNSAAD